MGRIQSIGNTWYVLAARVVISVSSAAMTQHSFPMVTHTFPHYISHDTEPMDMSSKTRGVKMALPCPPPLGKYTLNIEFKNTDSRKTTKFKVRVQHQK